MKVLRTPDSRFQNLPDFPYQPNYLEVKGANGSLNRMHYLDEGHGETILCLHGEPSWSFLYRKFIPVLSSHYRVVAPDFFGFGRSDKYTEVSSYSYEMHYQSLLDFIHKMKLKNITLVVQDWGGLLGLGALGEHPDLFARVVIMNTFLPTGKRSMPLPFKLWRAFARYFTNMPVGFVLKMACSAPMTKDVVAAYDAPFPDKSYKAGVRAFPLLVPDKPTAPGVTYMLQARTTLKEWQKPTLVMFSDKDPIMRGGHKLFMGIIPSPTKQPFIEIKGAGHFLQEDKGPEIAKHIKAFMIKTPLV